jgi:hypothetical protein
MNDMKIKTPILTSLTFLACLMLSAVRAQFTQQEAQRVLDVYRSTDLAPGGLPAEEKKTLEAIVGLLRENNIIGAKAAWQAFCNSIITRGTIKHAPEIENWILKKTYFRSGSESGLVIKGWEQKRRRVAQRNSQPNLPLIGLPIQLPLPRIWRLLKKWNHCSLSIAYCHYIE